MPEISDDDLEALLSAVDWANNAVGSRERMLAEQERAPDGDFKKSAETLIGFYSETYVPTQAAPHVPVLLRHSHIPHVGKALSELYATFPKIKEQYAHPAAPTPSSGEAPFA